LPRSTWPITFLCQTFCWDGVSDTFVARAGMEPRLPHHSLQSSYDCRHEPLCPAT
jgi:hypothetical protein